MMTRRASSCFGDPGAGKTHTFRQWAAHSGGRYITARAFLVTPAAKFDGALFIDGLDEKRAGRSDRDTVDALVGKLFAVGSGRAESGFPAAWPIAWATVTLPHCAPISS
jgi:hypothetical protein